MSKVEIYHNPRCSKSRQTLSLLQDNGIEPEVIEYLKQPPSVDDLKQLLTALGFSSARELMRSKEEAYKANDLANQHDEEKLLEAMHNHPKLIERPIVVSGSQARLGRPPEAVMDLFQ